MTPNVVAMQHYQQAQANPMQQKTFDQTDALLGELLRQVLEMRRDVEAVLAMLRAARQRGEQEMDYRGMVARGDLPPNALRHGTPR